LIKADTREKFEEAFCKTVAGGFFLQNFFRVMLDFSDSCSPGN